MVRGMSKRLSLAVLVSGGGTTLVNIQKRIDAGLLSAQVDLVIASNDKAAATLKTRGFDSPVTIRRKDFDDTIAFSTCVFEAIREASCELVCLAGFLSLLQIPDDFENRVLNIHPSLLPAFGGKGMHGHHVHEAVIAHGCKVSGCTVHFADNTYDTGPIVVQRTVPVLTGDNADALAARVFEQECEAYPGAIGLIADGRVRVDGRVAMID